MTLKKKKITQVFYNGCGHTNQSFVYPWPRFKITMFYPTIGESQKHAYSYSVSADCW